MAALHGELFSEIGRLVLDAHRGDAIDLDSKAEELALRYPSLGLSADSIARAIARSAGAVGISFALVANAQKHQGTIEPEATAFAVLPSGLRVAMLS